MAVVNICSHTRHYCMSGLAEFLKTEQCVMQIFTSHIQTLSLSLWQPTPSSHSRHCR